MSENSNGKGDGPRNNWSKEFRNNFDEINWSKAPKSSQVQKGQGETEDPNGGSQSYSGDATPAQS